MEKVILVIFSSLVSFTLSLDECYLYNTCHKCIQVPGCAWNFSEYHERESRCFSINETILKRENSTVYKPENALTIIQSKPIDDIIQNSPQKVEMKMRLHQPLYLPIWLKNSYNLHPFRLGNLIFYFIPVEPHKVMAKIEAVSCPKDLTKHHQTIDLSHQTNLSLTLDVEFLCACPCEHPDHYSYKTNAMECSGRGTYKCGVCECHSGAFGRRCECSGPVNPAGCTIYGPICSGRGDCVCGMCECLQRPNPDEIISGRFCECDNYSCPRAQGKLCGGQGSCECGRCVCAPGWRGYECTTSAGY